MNAWASTRTDNASPARKHWVTSSFTIPEPVSTGDTLNSVPPLKGLGRFLDCLPREKRLSNDCKNICGGNMRLSNREGRGRVSPVETGSGSMNGAHYPVLPRRPGSPIQPRLAQPTGGPGAPGRTASCLNSSVYRARFAFVIFISLN